MLRCTSECIIQPHTCTRAHQHSRPTLARQSQLTCARAYAPTHAWQSGAGVTEAAAPLSLSALRPLGAGAGGAGESSSAGSDCVVSAATSLLLQAPHMIDLHSNSCSPLSLQRPYSTSPSFTFSPCTLLHPSLSTVHGSPNSFLDISTSAPSSAPVVSSSCQGVSAFTPAIE